jgi:GAF domain-containing protein
VTDVVALHGAEFGNAQLVDSSVLRIVSAYRLPADFLSALGEVSLKADTVCARAARDRKVVVVPDIELDETFAPFLPAARAAGFRAVVSAPLVDSVGVFGVVSAHFARPHSPSAIELETLAAYCAQACPHLRKLHATASLRERQEHRTRQATVQSEGQ